MGGRADVLGHSMGGKAAMVLALTAPERVRRLIVADIAPVAYGHDQMRYVRAMQALDLADVTRRSDGDAALAAAVPEPGVRAFLLQSLAFEEGRARWKLNLEVLAERMPAIMDFPATCPASFAGPVLFLTGAKLGLRPRRSTGRASGRCFRRRARQAHAGRRPLAACRRAGGLHRGGRGLSRRADPDACARLHARPPKL